MDSLLICIIFGRSTGIIKKNKPILDLFLFKMCVRVYFVFVYFSLSLHHATTAILCVFFSSTFRLLLSLYYGQVNL